MTTAELQEYYDLIAEEVKFEPEKGQKWLLTFEERHTYAHDMVFHVYVDQGKYMLLTYEIGELMALDVREERKEMGETLSGNFRILMTTLRAELPQELEQESYARDGSRFKLSFAKKDKVHVYEWELPKGEFKRIKPVLKLLWALAGWREGAKAMGWSAKEGREKKKLGEGNASGDGKKQDRSGKGGRLDPFGMIWEP